MDQYSEGAPPAGSPPEGPGQPGAGDAGAAGSAAQAQWYYAVGGASYGPVSEQDLKALARQGQFQRDDYVYAEYLGDWVRADSIYGLFDAAGGYGVQAETPVAQDAGVAPPPMAGPQAIRRYVNYAGFWIRFAAVFIDGLVLAVPGCVLAGIMMAILIPIMANAGSGSGGSGPDSAVMAIVQVFANLGSVVISWLYFGFMESSKWQATLGKRAVGIFVTDLQGNPISFGRASGRYFASILSGLVLSIGYIIGAFTERKQTLHDMIVGTVVVEGRV